MKKILNKVDKLAALRVQQADLKKAADKLEAELKLQGVGEYAGSEHYANVYELQSADKVDWKAIAMKLKPSHQLVAAHTKPGKMALVLKLFGYKKDGAEVAA